MFLLVHVDDIVISRLDQHISFVQQKLQSIFKQKVLGDLKYFLGLEIVRTTKGICLSQRKYALSLLEDTGFIDAKLATIHMLLEK